MAGVRDGRLKLPHGATVPALPVVPGWKAMSGAGGGRGGDRKRMRRRPQRGGRGRREKEGGQRTAGEFEGILLEEGRKSSANFEGLLSALGEENGQGTSVIVDKHVVEGISLSTAEETTIPSFDAVVATAEVRGAAETEGAEGESQGGSISNGDESLTMETLDSVFPAPGPGADSGGGGGLGATSALESVSPGWSSCSSRNSNADQYSNSDSFESDDSAALGRGEEACLSDGGVGVGSRGTDHDGGNSVTDQTIMANVRGEQDDEVSVVRDLPDNVSDLRSDVEEQHLDADDNDNDDGRNASEFSSSPSIGRERRGSKVSPKTKGDHHGQPSTKLPIGEGIDDIDINQRRYARRGGAESSGDGGGGSGGIGGSNRQHARDEEALEGGIAGRDGVFSVDFGHRQLVENAPRCLSRPTSAQDEEEEFFALFRVDNAG